MKSGVVAIDGTSYVGKSTIAKCLASLMGYAYINTGHMFRSVAKLCLERGVDFGDVQGVLRLARVLEFDFRQEGPSFVTVVNGEDWSLRLDDYAIVFAASKVAVIPELRELLLEKQRRIAQRQTVVMEGRDIGTVVFPDARWKFFITASAEVRARRMHKMMPPDQKAAVADYRTLIPKVLALDEADKNRSVAPLIQARDAIIYDNSDSPSEMQDALILQYYINHASEIIGNSKTLAERQAE
jgi:cytidylate kinase